MAPLTAHRLEVWHEIAAMYRDDAAYTNLTQLGHACQAAHLAKLDGAADHEIVAALLHDCGWKLAACSTTTADETNCQETQQQVVHALEHADAGAYRANTHASRAAKLGILHFCDDENADAEKQRAQHDLIGAVFLRMRGFDERIPHLVEGHVLAKRYLCFKNPDYWGKLSPGSKRTLVFQGGPMTEAEARLFESDPLFERCLQMRSWDDSAKVPGLEVPSFDSYQDLVCQSIVACNRTAQDAQATTSFVRDGNTIVGIHDL